MDIVRWILIGRGKEKSTKAEIAEGWHFCNEWDGLLVGPGMPELEACLCVPRYTITPKGLAMLGEDAE